MSDPLADGISDLSVVQSMGSDLIVANAARVSYGKDRPVWDAEKDPKLIRFLLKNKHTSPFEHCMATFHVACPLFVRSQWHRHRTWAYNEISRRYTSEDIQFYVPKVWRAQDIKNKQSSLIGVIPERIQKEALAHETVVRSHAIEAYNAMIGDGVSREQARMILPQNLYTRFYATASLHNIMHFCTLRSDQHAQWEIRVFSDAISKEMMRLFPVSWGAYEETRRLG